MTAFELKPPYNLEELQGATLAFGPLSQMFDIKKTLSDGEGFIVTDDPDLEAALRTSPILQEAQAPEGAEPLSVTVLGRAEAVRNVQQEGSIPQMPPEVSPPVVHAEEPAGPDEAASQPSSQVEAQNAVSAGDGAEGDSSPEADNRDTARRGGR